MAELKPVSRDVYIKLTDPTGKNKPVITHHLVHNLDKFMASQVRVHEKESREEDLRVVDRATEAEYRKFRGYRGY